MKATVKCKLSPTREQVEALDETLTRCGEAMNYISQLAWEKSCFNRVALHHYTYRELRDRFGLTAQIAVSVRDKVAATYKADKSKQHIFKHPVLPLDPPRSFRLVNTTFASISTLRGRQKIGLVLGEYQLKYLGDKSWKVCGSEVTKNGEYYLHLVLEKEDPPDQETNELLGVDLGIKKLAVTSDGDSFAGEGVERTRAYYNGLRARLQKAGTLSAKRHLRRLSGAEKRFKSGVNHLISRRIVDKAVETFRGIVLEDLKGIHNRTKVRRSQNESHSKWAFDQLRQYISYKAKMAGIPVLFVDPRHSSQRCSSCGHTARGNRKNQSEFSCRACGFTLNADHNAALNLVWVAVNQPIVSDVALLQCQRQATDFNRW